MTDFLAKRGVNRILLALLDKGEIAATELVYEVKMHPRTVQNSRKLLQDLGLIKERPDSSHYPPLRYIALTEKGRRVAKLLKQIEEALSSGEAQLRS